MITGEFLFGAFVATCVLAIVVAAWGLFSAQPWRDTFREVAEFVGASLVLLFGCGLVTALYVLIVGLFLSPFVAAAYFVSRFFS